jgi:hypothetical protein
MSEVIIKIFSSETEATMAQQVLQQSGVRGFVFKDDAGGMQPHLQRTTGVRLVVRQEDADLAYQILQTLEPSQ